MSVQIEETHYEQAQSEGVGLYAHLCMVTYPFCRVPPVVNEESTVKQSFCVHEFNRLIMSLPILYMHIESTEVLSLIT